MTTTSETVDAVARVYAQSLLELADAAGGDEKIVETGGELGAITEMIRGDAEVAEFLRSPIIDSEKRGGPASDLRRPGVRSGAPVHARPERQGPAR